MIIPNSGMSSVVESSGVQTTSAFKIERSAHMFNILSSGLYSDKIAAVLREIGCNAQDAHIMGGCPELPIQVKLPSALDRSFYVKDWGPGLDDHEMQGLYCTYGASTKQANADTTGAFGLGCKSPFAYTMQNDGDSDGFTVETTKNGIKRIYTCYIGESGAPDISRLYEGPADADWPHGLKVTFPVQISDIREFNEKAREIYKWFKVEPEILGLTTPVKKSEFKMVGDSFAMTPTDENNKNALTCVIMGSVRYPLNESRLRDLSVVERALIDARIHLWVPLGTVMMTPSREELEYTDRTRRGVSESLKKAAKSVAEGVRDAVMVSDATKWDWCKKIQAYADTLPLSVISKLAEFLALAEIPPVEIQRITAVVRDKSATVPSWVGDGFMGPPQKFLRDPVSNDYVRTSEGLSIKDTSADMRGCRVFVYRRNGERAGTVVVSRREVLNGRVRQSAEKDAVLVLSYLEDIKCFYGDVKGGDTRVRHMVRCGEVRQVLLVLPVSPETDNEFVKSYAERMTSTGALEGLPLAPVSSLQSPTQSAAAKEKRKQDRLLTPREMYAENEVSLMGKDGTVSKILLGEVGETAQFYMCANALEGLTTNTRFYNGAHESRIEMQADCRADTFKSLNHVFQLLGVEFGGVVLVPTEAAARRLKLVEQGFEAFLPWLKTTIDEEENWSSLMSRVNRVPALNLSEMWRADDYGIYGIMGNHAVLGTEFWKQYKDSGINPALVAEVVEFVEKTSQKLNTKETSRTQECLLQLCSKVHGLCNSSKSFGVQGPSEIKEEFLKKYPMYSIVLERVLVGWMQKDVPRALAFLRGIQQVSLSFEASLEVASLEEVSLEVGQAIPVMAN
jgi:hypothetical protein